MHVCAVVGLAVADGSLRIPGTIADGDGDASPSLSAAERVRAAKPITLAALDEPTHAPASTTPSGHSRQASASIKSPLTRQRELGAGMYSPASASRGSALPSGAGSGAGGGGRGDDASWRRTASKSRSDDYSYERGDGPSDSDDDNATAAPRTASRAGARLPVKATSRRLASGDGDSEAGVAAASASAAVTASPPASNVVRQVRPPSAAVSSSSSSATAAAGAKADEKTVARSSSFLKAQELLSMINAHDADEEEDDKDEDVLGTLIHRGPTAIGVMGMATPQGVTSPSGSLTGRSVRGSSSSKATTPLPTPLATPHGRSLRTPSNSSLPPGAEIGHSRSLRTTSNSSLPPADVIAVGDKLMRGTVFAASGDWIGQNKQVHVYVADHAPGEHVTSPK